MPLLSVPALPKSISRRESMPSGDNVWGRRVSILPSMSWKKQSEIEIVLDGDNEFIHSYSTFDEITGHVNLRFEKDTCIDDFTISFQGQTNTWIEKVATASPTTGRTTGRHTFLRVQQPIDESCLPEYNRALAGETYTIPFKFVVPDKMLDFVCKHTVENDGVREQHLKLPPSIGDPMLSGRGNTLMDDLAPSMAKISYGIRVALLKASPSIRKAEVLQHEMGVRIIPARDELPPLSVDLMTDRFRGKYSLRKEKNVRKGVFNIGKKQGCLTAEAPQPASLKLHHPSRDSEEPITTMTKVQLRFDPASADEQPPSLNSITNKLRSFTFFGAGAWMYLPAPEGYDVHSIMHSQYPDSIDLSSRNLSNVEWVKHEPGSTSALTSTQRTKPLSIPSAYEKRPSKSLITSVPSNNSTGTHGSRSATDNPFLRRTSTFSTASSESISSGSSDDESSSSSHSASSTDLKASSVISPSTSYNSSLPYYTTSIVVPITLPTSSIPSASTTTSPSQSRRPSAIGPSSPTSSTSYTSATPSLSKSLSSHSKPIAFLPTFHSCLVSRVYSLELAIHSHGAPTITLRLPIQLSLPYDTAKQQQHQSSLPPPPLTTTTRSTWLNSNPFSHPPTDATINDETFADTGIDEALARALAGSDLHSQSPYSSFLPNVPEYEDTYQTIGREGGGGQFPPPARHHSLPLLDLQQQQQQRPTEAPPEYHSAIRRVSAARRAATASNAGGEGSDGRRLRQDNGGNVKSQGRRRSILFGL